MLPHRAHRVVAVLFVFLSTFHAAVASAAEGVPRIAGLLWKADTGSAVRTTPVVADGLVFVAGTDGWVRALRLADGEARWQIDLGRSIVATPTVDADTVYVVDRASTLHALRAADGLEHRLDPTRFVRIHRSAIVNLDRVREARSLGRGDRELRLECGTPLRVARRRREAFDKALAERQGGAGDSGGA